MNQQRQQGLTPDWPTRLAQVVNSTHAEVIQIRRLLEGDPGDPNSEGIKQIVARHDKAIDRIDTRLATVYRTAWGLLIAFVTAFVGAMIYGYLGVRP